MIIHEQPDFVRVYQRGWSLGPNLMARMVVDWKSGQEKWRSKMLSPLNLAVVEWAELRDMTESDWTGLAFPLLRFAWPSVYDVLQQAGLFYSTYIGST